MDQKKTPSRVAHVSSYPEKIAEFYIAISKGEPNFLGLIKQLKECKDRQMPVLRAEALQLFWVASTNFRSLIKVIESEFGFEDVLQLRVFDKEMKVIEPNFTIWTKAKEMRENLKTITLAKYNSFEKIIKEVYKYLHSRSVFWEALETTLKYFQDLAKQAVIEVNQYLCYLNSQKIDSTGRLAKILHRFTIDFVDVLPKTPASKRKPKDENKNSKKSKK